MCSYYSELFWFIYVKSKKIHPVMALNFNGPPKGSGSQFTLVVASPLFIYYFSLWEWEKVRGREMNENEKLIYFVESFGCVELGTGEGQFLMLKESDIYTLYILYFCLDRLVLSPTMVSKLPNFFLGLSIYVFFFWGVNGNS